MSSRVGRATVLLLLVPLGAAAEEPAAGNAQRVNAKDGQVYRIGSPLTHLESEILDQ